LEIHFFNTLPSTQTYLIDAIKTDRLKSPVAVVAYEQTNGVGSRENRWSGGEGNLFLSFAVSHTMLPSDLPLASASIYFSYLMKETLKRYGAKVWLKWPNDFYIDEKKVGGTVTHFVRNTLLCGIGVNLKSAPHNFASLGLNVPSEEIVKSYLKEVEKFPKWKQIFSEYRVEFEQSRRFYVHIENEKKSLKNAQLCEDGSLIIEGKKVYSLR